MDCRPQGGQVSSSDALGSPIHEDIENNRISRERRKYSKCRRIPLFPGLPNTSQPGSGPPGVVGFWPNPRLRLQSRPAEIDTQNFSPKSQPAEILREKRWSKSQPAEILREKLCKNQPAEIRHDSVRKVLGVNLSRARLQSQPGIWPKSHHACCVPPHRDLTLLFQRYQ